MLRMKDAYIPLVGTSLLPDREEVVAIDRVEKVRGKSGEQLEL